MTASTSKPASAAAGRRGPVAQVDRVPPVVDSRDPRVAPSSVLPFPSRPPGWFPSAPTKAPVPTINQLVRKGPTARQGLDPRCAARAEARRLRASSRSRPEAELGAAQGRARAPDERGGDHHLHPGRGAQPAGALGRAGPRRPRPRPAGRAFKGHPGGPGRRRGDGAPQGPLEVRREGAEVPRRAVITRRPLDPTRSTTAPWSPRW